MLARTKSADEHVAHDTWVGHDGHRSTAHGGYEVRGQIEDMSEDGRDMLYCMLWVRRMS